MAQGLPNPLAAKNHTRDFVDAFEFSPGGTVPSGNSSCTCTDFRHFIFFLTPGSNPQISWVCGSQAEVLALKKAEVLPPLNMGKRGTSVATQIWAMKAQGLSVHAVESVGLVGSTQLQVPSRGVHVH